MLKSILFALFLTPTIAFAETPARQIDFSMVINDLMGPAQDCDAVDAQGRCSKGVPMTLGRLVAEALLVPAKDEPLTKSAHKGALAIKLFSAGKISLPADDIALIEDCLPKLGFHTVIINNALKELDPDKAGG